ncbi:MAG TPA: hypothetical protein VKM35_13185 [Arenimonas sp.]|uniref:hypothetical protein n=1 Tax=Arenimonas sp. TaxID=1872635 RepID=UPI002D12E413|nr:hypothetical protein [Arenimonas sp.]HMB58147.1 hypothetical protein [Arenimonas sp.]
MKKLSLDTRNYRTVAQPNEVSAIHSLIDVEPEWFWAVMESLLDDGYLPNENIIALQEGRKQVVKEGNRRIAAMKIIHGIVSADEFSLPPHISEKLASLPASWKKANANVPCTVYAANEAAAADRVVTLTHGKGEKAGRLRWSAVARARHNRDKSGSAEPALDLLEKYLDKGKNLSSTQASRWAGEYPLTVLEDAMKRLAARLGQKSGPEVAKAYPKLTNRSGFEELMLDIGLNNIKFKDVRAENFGDKYGLSAPQQPAQTSAGGQGSTANTNSGSAGSATGGTEPHSGTGSGGAGSSAGTAKKGSNAHPSHDPRAVSVLVRKFQPKGAGRAKLATLLEELKQLDVVKTPHAFCFVLRSMFEVSAKAYCADHASAGGPKAIESNGNDRKLISVLKDVVSHLTNTRQNLAMVRELQGAIAELANPDSVLSVTSMNQLIHNPRYVISGTNVCNLFANVFPLLEEMNK